MSQTYIDYDHGKVIYGTDCYYDYDKCNYKYKVCYSPNMYHIFIKNQDKHKRLDQQKYMKIYY